MEYKIRLKGEKMEREGEEGDGTSWLVSVLLQEEPSLQKQFSRQA